MVPISPMVLQVLVHAGILNGDMKRQEALHDVLTLGADVCRCAVPEEELDHVHAEVLGGHVEGREAVAVAAVGVCTAAAKWSAALQCHPSTSQGVVGGNGTENLRVQELSETHEVRPDIGHVKELCDAILLKYRAQFRGYRT